MATDQEILSASQALVEAVNTRDAAVSALTDANQAVLNSNADVARKRIALLTLVGDDAGAAAFPTPPAE